MKQRHGQEQAQTVRRNQEARQFLSDRGGDRRVSETRSNAWIVALGVGRADWQRAYFHFAECFFGGMLDQLLEQALKRREDAIARIDWYEQEKRDAEATIAVLERLSQELAEANDKEKE
jgi:hypothetical protein